MQTKAIKTKTIKTSNITGPIELTVRIIPIIEFPLIFQSHLKVFLIIMFLVLYIAILIAFVQILI